MDRILVKCLTCLGLLVGIVGCKSFLDATPDKQLVVPRTLDDLQALLDFDNGLFADPSAGQMSADDCFLTDDDLAGLLYEEDRRMYRWEKEAIFIEITDHWRRPYRQVYYANVILETVGNTTRDESNRIKWDNIKGQALFLRARGLLSAVLIWADAYDPQEGVNQLGIPVRTDPDYNIPSTRASLAATYQQIIDDLATAKELLPDHAEHVNRASGTAASALLARVYLLMGDYQNSLKFADTSLQLQGELMDYNDLDTNTVYPFVLGNKEVIFNATLSMGTAFFRRVDTLLFESYDEQDLRKRLYFDVRAHNYYSFKGSYHGDIVPFSGIAVDEVYLIRAESNARLGNRVAALEDINHLLSMRYEIESFEPLDIGNDDVLLRRILLERRKELVFRNLRWPDIKRLNKDGEGINLVRVVNGIRYQLAANDPRFVFPIPDDIIRLTGMEQNP